MSGQGTEQRLDRDHCTGIRERVLELAKKAGSPVFVSLGHQAMLARRWLFSPKTPLILIDTYFVNTRSLPGLVSSLMAAILRMLHVPDSQKEVANSMQQLTRTRKNSDSCSLLGVMRSAPYSKHDACTSYLRFRSSESLDLYAIVFGEALCLN